MYQERARSLHGDVRIEATQEFHGCLVIGQEGPSPGNRYGCGFSRIELRSVAACLGADAPHFGANRPVAETRRERELFLAGLDRLPEVAGTKREGLDVR